MKKIYLPAFFILATLLIFNSCSNDNGFNFDAGSRNTDHSAFTNFNYFIGVNQQTRLVLEGINGSIKISPTTDIAATIAGERKVQSNSDADATNYLENLKVVVEDRGNEVYVYTDQPNNTNGRILTVTYTIKIPAVWNTVISNTNGGLQADSLSGTIKANIVNGSIVLNDINGSIDLELVNGTISSRQSIADDSSCKMNLTNGTIALFLPQVTNAVLDARVVNGSVFVSGLTMSNIESTTTSFNGTIGSGAASINLAAVNGEINVAGY